MIQCKLISWYSKYLFLLHICSCFLRPLTDRHSKVKGNLGLWLLIFEGGLHLSLRSLRAVGVVAVVVAVTGTLAPCLLGWLVLVRR
jgi:Kef-type K+ transport system membrane component KefB